MQKIDNITYLLSGFATKAEEYNLETNERYCSNLRSLFYWTKFIVIKKQE
jgi:hypothetical protein